MLICKIDYNTGEMKRWKEEERLTEERLVFSWLAQQLNVMVDVQNWKMLLFFFSFLSFVFFAYGLFWAHGGFFFACLGGGMQLCCVCSEWNGLEADVANGNKGFVHIVLFNTVFVLWDHKVEYFYKKKTLSRLIIYWLHRFCLNLTI